LGSTIGFRAGSTFLRLAWGGPSIIICFLGMVWYSVYHSVPKSLADYAAIPEVWTHKEVLNYVMLATTVFIFVRMIPCLTAQPAKDDKLKAKAE
jgi:large-conductance mechanosensitive channel